MKMLQCCGSCKRCNDEGNYCTYKKQETLPSDGNDCSVFYGSKWVDWVNKPEHADN